MGKCKWRDSMATEVRIGRLKGASTFLQPASQPATAVASVRMCIFCGLYNSVCAARAHRLQNSSLPTAVLPARTA